MVSMEGLKMGKKREMTVKDLKQILNGLPDNMEVFVACEGYSNWNFKENRPWNEDPTLHEVRDGKLFICDSCAYDY